MFPLEVVGRGVGFDIRRAHEILVKIILRVYRNASVSLMDEVG